MIFKNLFRRRKPSESPLLAIVGLGNPGEKYAETRHNAGFLALDFLREQFGFEAFREEKKFFGLLSSGLIGRKKILLVKPLTFMNESGKCIRALLAFYKLSPRELVVIHDDIDLAPGKLKKTSSSSSAGHNGVQSIIDTLGTQDFTRIRLGIGRPGRQTSPDDTDGPLEQSSVCVPVHDYVLRPFGEEEREELNRLFPEIRNALKAYLE